MKTTIHPFDFSVAENFPNARRVRRFEGGCAYLAERDGTSYVIIDEGTLADLVDYEEDNRELVEQLVRIVAFDTEAERSQYLRAGLLRDATAGQIRFLPWEGEQYRSAGLGGVRLLLLGESHYDSDGAGLGFDFTQFLTRSYVDGTMNHRFWTLAARAVVGQATSREQCQAFWNNVAFYNYVQEAVGGARMAPAAEVWTAARRPFRLALEMVAPQAILVLGKRLWSNLPGGISVPHPADGRAWRTYDVGSGASAIATFINHPASFGFSARSGEWAAAVAALLDQGHSS